MDTTIATANALHRMLLQSLIATRRPGRPVEHDPAPSRTPPAEYAETLPMLYRSEAFAEDLLDLEGGMA